MIPKDFENNTIQRWEYWIIFYSFTTVVINSLDSSARNENQDPV
jgi:hypothetical protein